MPTESRTSQRILSEILATFQTHGLTNSPGSTAYVIAVTMAEQFARSEELTRQATEVPREIPIQTLMNQRTGELHERVLSNEIPDGFIIPDGRSLSRIAFPELYAALGVSYGSIDDRSFGIPDRQPRSIFVTPEIPRPIPGLTAGEILDLASGMAVLIKPPLGQRRIVCA
jgi:hypothetical protein